MAAGTVISAAIHRSLELARDTLRVGAGAGAVAFSIVVN